MKESRLLLVLLTIWGRLLLRERKWKASRWKLKLLLFWWLFEFMCSMWTYFVMFLPLVTRFWRIVSALLC